MIIDQCFSIITYSVSTYNCQYQLSTMDWFHVEYFWTNVICWQLSSGFYSNSINVQSTDLVRRLSFTQLIWYTSVNWGTLGFVASFFCRHLWIQYLLMCFILEDYTALSLGREGNTDKPFLFYDNLLKFWYFHLPGI